ncbi:hypothetical protein KDK_10410 [Dictyobacter kobayashii]|uniref:N-acetyltransferase domain-containing protein n=1 Tax=Dictyobacter kobayashii TaxID=2014872 RepID=A0A402ADS2_9CHLR|nr:hypothetical protein KDK_10410 [Dictyobacter kobayashii]
MIIRLHQLSARAPRLQDISEVASLLSLYEGDALTSEKQGEAELRNIWQDSSFQLMHDAWVIVTRQGQVVGYADVQQKCSEPLEVIYTLAVAIHPDYQGRGIETLLIRLGEDRIRQLTREHAVRCQVSIQIAVSSSNELLSEIVQHEGYGLQQQFLRMHLALEHVAAPSLSANDGLLTLQVVLNADEQSLTARKSRIQDTYKALKYSVYAKKFGRIRQPEVTAVLLPCVAG